MTSIDMGFHCEIIEENEEKWADIAWSINLGGGGGSKHGEELYIAFFTAVGEYVLNTINSHKIFCLVTHFEASVARCDSWTPLWYRAVSSQTPCYRETQTFQCLEV